MDACEVTASAAYTSKLNLSRTELTVSELGGFHVGDRVSQDGRIGRISRFVHGRALECADVKTELTGHLIMIPLFELTHVPEEEEAGD